MDTFSIVMIALVLVAILVSFGAQGVKAAFASGRRAAFKEAIEIARQRADVSLYLAPEGDLKIGLVRARAAYDIELSLREALSWVR